ncbi:hypothetical protein D3C76_27850 [compost metagenome]
MAGCGADIEANELIQSLTTDNDFTIPDVDFNDDAFKFPGDGTGPMYEAIHPLKESDLTTRTVGGAGLFDGLMVAIGSHLEQQFDKGRIAGAEYTKAYIAAFEGAMGNAVQFLLSKDSAFWQAQTAQVQAITARVQLETSKVQLAAVQLEAMNQKANYALTKMRLATESVNYCIAQFNLTQMLPAQKAGQDLSNDIATYNLANLLPAQLALSNAQKEGQLIENDTASYNLGQMFPMQLALTTAQKEGQEVANDTASYNLTVRLPKEVENLGYQGNMLKEQTEAQRAQTLDTRLDGSPVVGVLGKQKALYAQQIVSYQRDSELKAARIWSDAWITQKTIDEGLVPPDTFTNTNVNEVLETVRINNNLG